MQGDESYDMVSLLVSPMSAVGTTVSNHGELENLKKRIRKNVVEIGLSELSSDNPIIKMLVNFDCPLRQKYSTWTLWQMVQDYYQKNYRELQECFESLIHYGTDLLRPETDRTPGWHTVRMSAVLRGIQGSTEILQQFGYTTAAGRNGDLTFPSTTQPNFYLVSSLLIELIVCLSEIRLYSSGEHEHPQYIRTLLSGNSSSAGVPSYSGMTQNETVKRPTSDIRLAQQVYRALGHNSAAAAAAFSPKSVSLSAPLSNLVEDEAVRLQSPFVEQSFSLPFPAFEPVAAPQNISSLPSLSSRVSSSSPSKTSLAGTPSVQPFDKGLNLTASYDAMCDICGLQPVSLTCPECDNKMLCDSCDSKWHRHVKRKHHQIVRLSVSSKSAADVREPMLQSRDRQRTPEMTTAYRLPTAETTAHTSNDVNLSVKTDLRLTDPASRVDRSSSKAVATNVLQSADGDDILQWLSNAKSPPQINSGNRSVSRNSSLASSQPSVSSVSSHSAVRNVAPSGPVAVTVQSGLMKSPHYESGLSSTELYKLGLPSTSFATLSTDIPLAGMHGLNTLPASGAYQLQKPTPYTATTGLEHERYGRVTDEVPGVVHYRLDPTSSEQPYASFSSITAQKQFYQSKFVEVHDEIYQEKKRAHQQYLEQQQRQQEVENPQRHVEAVPLSQFSAGHGNANTLRNQLPTTVLQSSVLGELSYMQPAIQQSGSERYLKSSDHHKSFGSVSGVESRRPEETRHSSVEESLNSIHQRSRAYELQISSINLIRAIRAAVCHGIAEDDVHQILACNDSSVEPADFISKTWMPKVKHTIVGCRDALKLNERCNPVSLASAALLETKGNVEQAVDKFVSKWNAKVGKLLQSCSQSPTEENYHHFSSKLAEYNGHDEQALTSLVTDKFLRNIYAEETGGATVEDEKDSNLNEQLAAFLKDSEVDLDRRVRMIMCEANLPGWQRAVNVITLLTEVDGASLIDVVEAVRSQGSIERCRQFLKRECECAVCYCMYSLTQMRSLPACQCRVCVDCIRGHFEVVIRERYIRNLVCPVCGQPDIDNGDQTDAYFDVLSILFGDVLPKDVIELFHMKLRDWNLMMDQSFRWCANSECRCGFLVDRELENQKKVVCPHCFEPMCQNCKKVWEDQHEGLTCEDFQLWKEENDPEVQAMGLAKHLEENGIECPQCKCRYSLAKGGCMHFTCIQCRHEFCSGCMEDFKRGKNCKKFKSCAKAGLHCHHPRDCLFYLRDRDVDQLQKLLKDYNIPYNAELPNEGTETRQCTVMEQKHTQSGFKDEPCGNPVLENSAGLCDVHYREYLVDLINRNKIDPVEVMEEKELKLLLEKNEKKVPAQHRGETATDYKQRLLQCVVKELPLPARKQYRKSALKPVAASTGGVSASGGGASASTSKTAPVLVIGFIGIDETDGMSNG